MKKMKTTTPMTMMRTNSFPRATLPALLCCALFLLSSVQLNAGEKPKPYALIFGTVFGPDQHTAAGVKIKIRRASDKKAKWELVSDRRGEFAQRLPAEPMDYLVWADLKDRQAAQKTEVKVHVEKDERQDIALHLTE